MSRDKETISASEIGQYLYCHYQWYYNRIYGAEHLRELRKAYLAEHGVETDATESAFARGRKFHEGWRGRQRRKRALAVGFALLILLAVGIWAWWTFGSGFRTFL